MFMKKVIKKQVTLSLITVFMLAIVIFGSSYALFQESFSDTNTQTLNVGDLSVAFSNTSNNALTDSDAIDLSNLTPMPDSTALNQSDNLYSFVIANNGTISYCYTIKLQDNPSYTTNLLSHQYIRYKLNDEAPALLSSTTNGFIGSHTINPNETDSYQLRIWVADAEEYNLPNETLGQEVHLNIVIEGEACAPRAPKGYYEATSGSLLAGIRNNQSNNQPTYTNPGQAVSTTDEGLRETEDDYGTTFYYRGAVENNYLSFANMCWRIVRIDGNGNIKITLYNYNPTSAANPCASSLDGADKAFARYDNTVAGQDGGSAFNSTVTKNTYVGFMYSNNPDSTDYATAHANNNDSTALTNLKTWYDLVFTSAQKEKLADVIWCNDKRVVTDTTFDPYSMGSVVGTGVGTAKTYYAAFERFVPYDSSISNYSSAIAAPSLKCGINKTDNMISKFTASTQTDGGYGNGLLNGYKIGLLTADEVVYAGGSLVAANSYYYLYKNANNGVSRYLLMTPGVFTGTVAYTLNANETGYVDGNSSDVVYGLRPAVSLKSNVTISGGVGTQANPFVVN